MKMALYEINYAKCICNPLNVISITFLPIPAPTKLFCTNSKPLLATLKLINSSFKQIKPIIFSTLLTSFFILPSTLLHAENVARSASIDFFKLSTAKAVTFLWSPWTDMSWAHLSQWNESNFRDFSCTFTTQDPAKIGSLLMLLQRADIKEIGPQETTFNLPNDTRFMADAYQGIYLTLADGSQATFLFGAELGSAKTRGQFTYAQLKDYPISANAHLPWYLIYWASQLEKPTAKENYIVEKCESIISKDVYFSWRK